MDLKKWNAIIYKNSDGTSVSGGLYAEELWKEFGIKSYPLFKDKCYYHVPSRWEEDVRIMLHQIQSELGDRVVFKQIKESFCELIVYRSTKDDEATKRIKEIIVECINRLRDKGVYPPTNQ